MADARFFEAKTNGTPLRHTHQSLRLNEGAIQAVVCALQKLEPELKDKNPKNSYIDCQFELAKLVFALEKFIELTQSKEYKHSLQKYCSTEFVKKIKDNHQPLTMQDLFDIMTSGISVHDEVVFSSKIGSVTLG